MDFITKKQIPIAVSVGVLHFFLAAFLTIAVLAAGNQPIGRPGDGWLLLPFLIVMFPTSILGCVGAFTNSILAFALIPVTSILWGFAAARLFSRFYDRQLLDLRRAFPSGWKMTLYVRTNSGWIAKFSRGTQSCRLVSEWGKIEGVAVIDGTTTPLYIPDSASSQQIAAVIQQEFSESPQKS